MNEDIYYINQKGETKDLIKFQICGTTYPDKNYKIDRKNSDVACIEYIEEGIGTVSIDGKTFYPSKGDSYFLHAGKDQHYFSDCSTPWKKHFINVSGKLLDGLSEIYGVSNTSHFQGLDLSRELHEIIELVRQNREDCTAELIAILNKILLKMHNHIKKTPDRNGLENEMKDFLNTQITQKFDLSVLCKQISKSESQVIRTFKKAYGITPYAYVLNKKIDLAKKLLESTNLTIKQVADKLCFTDEYYFSNIFKKKTGVSPLSYRKHGISANK